MTQPTDRPSSPHQPLPPAPDGITITAEEPLAAHSYLRIGGPARGYAEPTTPAQLDVLVDWARTHGIGLRVLGGGSNLIASDDGVDALVVSLRRCCGGFAFEGAADEPRTVTAGAGVMLPALARAAAAEGLGGLEFGIGIPGTVGGALNSNAGIGDGRDIGSLVQRVEVLGARGRMTIPRTQLTFGYRRSSLRGAGVLVLAATLLLAPRPPEAIEADMRALLEARQASQPTADPNAGSIFRNPEDDFAGRLIEATGLKGLSHGGARVSEQHANFIVHDGGATAADIVALMTTVQARVAVAHGIRLQPEIEWWGDGDIPAVFTVPEPDEPTADA